MESVEVGDLSVAYLDEGAGPPVVLLHGFPDGPWTFDHLAETLVGDGWRVIRPWLRGYPPTGVPEDRTTSVPQLVADLEGLADALDLDQPVLIGHDWGAVVGWEAASGHDHRWRAFVSLAIPPPPVQARAMRDPVQAVYRSGYMWQMNLPGIERLLPRLVRRLYRRWSPGWDPPPDHLERVLAMIDQPGAARAMVAYYRWIIPAVLTLRHPSDRRAVPEVPLRYLHGRSDTCFPASAAEQSRRVLPDGTVRIVERCGHFLHLERPEEIADDLRRFLNGLPG